MFRIVEDSMPPLPDECSDLAHLFLTQCFNKDPSKRPSAKLLLEHPWLQNWSSQSDISPPEHSFVKTTFSKRASTIFNFRYLNLINLAMICRVCLLNVKKSAAICSQCSLISHLKCAPNAPPTCDLRAQLLHYA